MPAAPKPAPRVKKPRKRMNPVSETGMVARQAWATRRDAHLLANPVCILKMWHQGNAGGHWTLTTSNLAVPEEARLTRRLSLLCAAITTGSQKNTANGVERWGCL